jgi:hypothetical protein
MSKTYSPKIVTDGLVMCLDPSQNKSYPTNDLPVKNGLVMWMDAADDTTFSYSSGTTVSQWRDKSGFGYHMVPKVSGPTRNAFLNSRKVLAFTTSQTIGNNTINLASSANTVFVVSRLTGTTNGRVLTCNLDSSGNNWLLGHHGGTYNDYYAEGWVTDGGSLDTNWRMYMGDWSGTSTDLANFYSNGTAITTNSTAASQGPNKLGVNYFSSELSTCEVAEIVVFNRVLSTAERRLVHTYLGQKWGISNTDRSIIDLSGNNNNGLLGNGTTSDMPLFDVYNKGNLNFDGTNDAVIIANNFLPTNSSFSISTWVKIKIVRTSALIDSMNDSAAYDGFALWITSGGKFIFYILKNTVTSITSLQSYSTDTWYNVVAIYNQSTIAIYINGVLDVSTAYSSGFDVGTANIGLGRRGANSNDPTSCNIAQVSFYNRGLSATEISQNYETQKSRFANTIVQQGLVLNLDAGNPYSYAGSGTTWYDASGTGNNGTLTNGPVYNSINGGVITLDGIDDYITCANSASLQITSALTLETWFYNTAAVDGLGMIVKGPLSSDYDYMLYLSGNSTTAYFYKKDSGGGIHYGGTTLSLLNRWLHIVVTHTSGGVYTMYANGVAIDSAGFSNSTIRSTSNPLFIGAGWNPDYFYGNIGETRIYNIALSAAQVLQNYNATKGRYGL